MGKNQFRIPLILCFALGLLLFGGSRSMVWKATAQSKSPVSTPAGLELQRSVALYNYQTTAVRGPLRGEELYFIKCWMCHNDYTIKAGTGAVPLKDLFERSRLASTGEPVNDETVAEKIRNGGPGMPAYRHSMSDQDMADIISYIKDPRCCFDAEEPPPNPWYKY